jgi:hypothetical protein
VVPGASVVVDMEDVMDVALVGRTGGTPSKKLVYEYSYVFQEERGLAKDETLSQPIRVGAWKREQRKKPHTVAVTVLGVVVEVDEGVILVVLAIEVEVVVVTGVVVLTVVLTIVALGTIIMGTEEVLIRVEDGVTVTVELKTPTTYQFQL